MVEVDVAFVSVGPNQLGDETMILLALPNVGDTLYFGSDFQSGVIVQREFIAKDAGADGASPPRIDLKVLVL